MRSTPRVCSKETLCTDLYQFHSSNIGPPANENLIDNVIEILKFIQCCDTKL